MGHVTSKQPWGTLDIDTTTGIVLIREDWHYSWQPAPGAHPFTLHQKRTFHNRLDREIWGRWSWHFKVRVRGTVPFAEKFSGRTLTLNFDIRWVRTGGDWQVTVVILPKGTAPGVNRPSVTFGALTINLYTTMFQPYTAANAQGTSRPGFVAGPHEFGHTIANPDEYLITSPNVVDADSLMNVGHQLRTRHITLILDTLNTMIPGAVFYV